MATRTTSAAVRKIIRVTSGDDLSPFIESASFLVDTYPAAVDDPPGATELELVERWLTAHFYSIYKPRHSREIAGKVHRHLISKVDLGFDVTHHGQMAMRLDSTGTLAMLNEQAKNGSLRTATLTWLGTEEGVTYD